MAKKNGVWIATLYRFGYDLEVVAKTEAEAVSAIMANYEEAYEEINGVSPKEDFRDDEETITYYDNAREDVETRFCEFCVVEWR